jgi:hypothetical protein
VFLPQVVLALFWPQQQALMAAVLPLEHLAQQAVMAAVGLA